MHSAQSCAKTAEPIEMPSVADSFEPMQSFCAAARLIERRFTYLPLCVAVCAFVLFSPFVFLYVVVSFA